MMLAILSITLTTGFALSPRPAAATPKNKEKITNCRISLVAIASTTLLGMAWVTKSFSVIAVALIPDFAAISGSGKFKPTPGLSKLTITRPKASDTSEAVMNQAIALIPTRPTVWLSPILAMPTTSVENTNGAIIILIRRKKMSVKIDILDANSVTAAGSVTFERYR